MSVTLCVSGASDDLVEVDGDVQLEYGCYDEEKVDVLVNGVPLLRVVYDDEGLWRVTETGQVPGVTVQVYPTPGEDLPRDPEPPHRVASYSDYAIVTGAVTSVVVGSESWTEWGW